MSTPSSPTEIWWVLNELIYKGLSTALGRLRALGEMLAVVHLGCLPDFSQPYCQANEHGCPLGRHSAREGANGTRE